VWGLRLPICALGLVLDRMHINYMVVI
jgi:hypothetical protein